jgi:hypothetical protein
VQEITEDKLTRHKRMREGSSALEQLLGRRMCRPGSIGGSQIRPAPNFGDSVKLIFYIVRFTIFGVSLRGQSTHRAALRPKRPVGPQCVGRHVNPYILASITNHGPKCNRQASRCLITPRSGRSHARADPHRYSDARGLCGLGPFQQLIIEGEGPAHHPLRIYPAAGAIIHYSIDIGAGPSPRSR